MDDFWKICSARGGCSETAILRNKQFPVVLQSYGNKHCLDCSGSSTWCKQAHSCPAYVNSEVSDVDKCSQPEQCRGPQFQVHNFRLGSEEGPIEVLDEIHFSYGDKQDNQMRLLTGDIYKGSMIRLDDSNRIIETPQKYCTG